MWKEKGAACSVRIYENSDKVRFHVSPANFYKLEVWHTLGILQDWNYSEKRKKFTGFIDRLEPMITSPRWYGMLWNWGYAVGFYRDAVWELNYQNTRSLRWLKYTPYSPIWDTLQLLLEQYHFVSFDINERNCMFHPKRGEVIWNDIFYCEGPYCMYPSKLAWENAE